MGSSQTTWQDMDSGDSGTANEPTDKQKQKVLTQNTPEVMAYLDKVAKEQQAKKEAQRRKERPVFSGVLQYFPLALMEVANCSYIGNEQHNPGTPLHWDRDKSGDELEALTRHLLEAGTIDTDGVRHSVKLTWRALANLQKELEREQGK